MLVLPVWMHMRGRHRRTGMLYKHVHQHQQYDINAILHGNVQCRKWFLYVSVKRRHTDM